MDKYELDGNPVRCVGLQHTHTGLTSALVLTSHMTLGIHLTSSHLQNRDDRIKMRDDICKLLIIIVIVNICVPSLSLVRVFA